MSVKHSNIYGLKHNILSVQKEEGRGESKLVQKNINVSFAKDAGNAQCNKPVASERTTQPLDDRPK